MLIKYLPVLPPNLRPIIKMPNNTNISSDFNILYQEIITTNKKLNKIKKMFINTKLIKQQKQLLQLKVDKLINKANPKTKIKIKEVNEQENVRIKIIK